MDLSASNILLGLQLFFLVFSKPVHSRVYRTHLTPPGEFRTNCAALLRTGAVPEGLYTIDPDGILNGVQPVNVTCSNGRTTIPSKRPNLNKFLSLIFNFEFPVEYEGLTIKETVAVIDSSTECAQVITYKCLFARTDTTSWYDRHGERFTSWARGYEDHCYEGQGTCSCNFNELNGEHVITDKARLPVTDVRSGNRRSFLEEATTSVGEVTCTGDAREAPFNVFPDVDECAHGTHQCYANTLCTNTDGSYECSCLAGFASADGVQCTDIDECNSNTHNCDINAACNNSPEGSFTCICNSGYTGDGITCTSETSGSTVAVGIILPLIFIAVVVLVVVIIIRRRRQNVSITLSTPAPVTTPRWTTQGDPPTYNDTVNAEFPRQNYYTGAQNYPNPPNTPPNVSTQDDPTTYDDTAIADIPCKNPNTGAQNYPNPPNTTPNVSTQDDPTTYDDTAIADIPCKNPNTGAQNYPNPPNTTPNVSTQDDPTTYDDTAIADIPCKNPNTGAQNYPNPADTTPNGSTQDGPPTYDDTAIAEIPCKDPNTGAQNYPDVPGNIPSNTMATQPIEGSIYEVYLT